GPSQGSRVVLRPPLPGLRIECRCGVEKQAVGHESTTGIPDGSSDHGARPGDATHLGKRIVRTRYEVEHGQRENAIEAAIRRLESTGIAYAELESWIRISGSGVLDVDGSEIHAVDAGR